MPDQKFKPIREYVLVRKIDTGVQRRGSIILPDQRKADLLPGIVVAVGTGYVAEKTGKITPLEISPGDKVYYSEWAGKEVVIDGETLLVMEEEDIAGIMEENNGQ